MRKAHFARLWYRAAADQARLRYGVVRRFEWPLDDQPGLARQPRNGMDLRYLDGLVKFERRQYGRQPLGQHRLARPRRTNKKYVMPTRARDFEGPFGGLLAANLVEI